MRARLRCLILSLALLASGGCFWEQLFLFGVDVELDFRPRTWTEFTCVRFPASSQRLEAGEIVWSGKLSLEGSARSKLPRKARVRARVRDVSGALLWQQVHLVRIRRPSGEFRELVDIAESVTFPAGSELCWAAKFFRPGFDGRVVWLDRSRIPASGEPR